MLAHAILIFFLGNIYLGGPPLVKAATGEVVSGEELGGATMHCSVSGITDHFAQDEQESFEIIKDVVASLNINEAEEKKCGFVAPEHGGNEMLDTIAGINRFQSKKSLELDAYYVFFFHY